MAYTVIVSAILYALAFVYPVFGFVLIIAALSLLFYGALDQQYTLIDGLLWGSAVYVVHALPLSTYLHTYSRTSIALVGWILFGLYTASYAGVWFFLTSFICSAIDNKYILFYKLIVWMLTTFLYIQVMTTCFLWIFDICEGYCCLHPLVPLMETKALRSLVYYLGIHITTFIIIITACVLVFFWASNYKKLLLLMAAFLLSVYWYADQSYTSTAKPSWLSQVAYASVPFDTSLKTNAHEIGLQVLTVLQKTRDAFPDATLLLMPESTFPYCLQEYDAIMRMWRAWVLNSPEYRQAAGLMLGAHRNSSCNSRVYNTCYYCTSDGVLEHYDKIHGLFFAERLPEYFKKSLSFFNFYQSKNYNILKNKLKKNSCSDKNKYFEQAFDSGTVFKWNDQIIVPFICSEFFFGSVKQVESDTILCLVNDAWFGYRYMRNILFLNAVLRACDEHKTILYVSHARGTWIDQYGNQGDLPSISTPD